MDVQLGHDPLRKTSIDVKKCPRCRSLYLTDRECEACGFQLNFSFIGEPFGHMSFYNLKDAFYSMGSLRKIAYFIFAKKYRRYMKYELSLKRRLDNLLDYFFNHIDIVEKRKKLFFLELTQIADEFKTLDMGVYLSEKIKDKVMNAELEKIGHNSIYVSEITSWINHQEKNKRRPKDYLRLKIFGAITVGNILLAAFICVVTLLVLIKMYRYLLPTAPL